MAHLRFSALTLAFVLFSLSAQPSQSLICTSQKFSNDNLYANCTDLPFLHAFLHWTYHSSNSSLSIAFVAPPASPAGWVAWAINPTGTGMIGAQALLALRSNGSIAVKTYNISSYESIVESNLSFPVSNRRAEQSNGVMRIFAVLTLPKNTTTVNQVWQVGAAVANGHPTRHEFQPANLNSKGPLNLLAARSQSDPASTQSTRPASAPSGGQTGGENGAAPRIATTNLAFLIFLIFIAIFSF